MKAGRRRTSRRLLFGGGAGIPGSGAGFGPEGEQIIGRLGGRARRAHDGAVIFAQHGRTRSRDSRRAAPSARCRATHRQRRWSSRLSVLRSRTSSSRKRQIDHAPAVSVADPMTHLVQRSPVPIDRLEICFGPRHLHIVLDRTVEGRSPPMRKSMPVAG